MAEGEQFIVVEDSKSNKREQDFVLPPYFIQTFGIRVGTNSGPAITTFNPSTLNAQHA